MSARVAASSRTPCRMLERLAVDEAAERPRRLAERRARAAPGSRPAARARTARRRAAPRARRSAPAGSRSADRRPTSQKSSGDAVSAKCAVSGRPVRKYTSSARTSRFTIARLNPRRRLRDRRAAASGAATSTPRRAAIAFEPRAQRVVARRARKQAARQRAVIEAGAADEDRQLPRAWMSRIDRRRVARVLRGGVLLGRIGDVDQVMRDAALLRDRAPCRCRCRSRDRRRSSRS